ncbi:Flp pilus assembly protein CpaB [Salinarimonas soli]|uniref:Flp pilus assembly protein CpaB n=1 Tax=Salinarimonas soli TaxID=1638099 RepID=A0A5B2V7K6_9HYPH|nr:Flp pilus assembly protein CpaB [Salinarimonas soli]KAA2234951.1 Flp pilus assembly protein CpaB [Salinarimonas soli]
MRSKTLVMIALAAVFGFVAIFAGQKWLDRQSGQRLREMQVVAARPAAPTATLVVAALPLRWGTEITRQHLREVAWPGDALPKGAFARIDDVLDGRNRRVALSAMEENEPLLAAKVTGPGGRASLAAVLGEGMKAATVRVNDVLGVAGFVLPGDRVDVMLTRVLDKGEAFSDVIAQSVRVLAVDQTADERSDKPAVVKAVTLEVTTAQAQKVTLATAVGTLSLAMRSPGAPEGEGVQRVSLDDLGRPLPREADKPAPGAVMTSLSAERTNAAVGVTRALKRQEYSVPVDAKP